jgi:hypothetical protein
VTEGAGAVVFADSETGAQLFGAWPGAAAVPGEPALSCARADTGQIEQPTTIANRSAGTTQR